MSFFVDPPPLRVKICGITNPEDAEAAIRSGADALGFNFAIQSKRRLDFLKAKSWISALAGKITRIAVVVNPLPEDLADLQDAGCFEAIQFHGDETPEFCASAEFSTWIRAIRVKDHTSVEEALKYPTPYLLLDAWAPDQYGGTGKRLDWDRVRDIIIAHPDRKFILAGGLDPSNIRDAVRIVRPYGVDVAGGVEIDPLHKDEYLVREFIRIAQST